jgi:antitoxin VapB
MPVQIKKKAVVAKIEALARAIGLSKTAAVEKAVDRLLAEQDNPAPIVFRDRFDAILEEFDRIPDLDAAFNPLEWDDRGLPR